MSWRNWKAAMLSTVILILLFWFPFSRRVILFLLPLGSGIDDLVFFVLLIAAAVLIMIRAAPVRNKLHALAKWFTK